MPRRRIAPRTTDPDNLTIDGRRVREARFDYDFPPIRPPHPFDAARDAFRALPPAQQEALELWGANALEPRAPRPGWSYDGPATGIVRSDGLANLAGGDCGFLVPHEAMKGLLLMSGYWPTMGTSNARVWKFGAAYLGPDKATAARIANLLAS